MNFLSFPREIRDQIYSDLLIGDPIYCEYTKSSSCFGGSYGINSLILLANSQTYHEACEVLVHNSHLFINLNQQFFYATLRAKCKKEGRDSLLHCVTIRPDFRLLPAQVPNIKTMVVFVFMKEKKRVRRLDDTGWIGHKHFWHELAPDFLHQLLDYVCRHGKVMRREFVIDFRWESMSRPPIERLFDRFMERLERSGHPCVFAFCNETYERADLLLVVSRVVFLTSSPN